MDFRSGITQVAPAALIVVAAGLCACHGADPHHFVNPGGNEIPPGPSPVVEQTYPVSGVRDAVLDGVGQLFIQQGGTETLLVRTQQHILPFIEVEQQGGRLVMGFEDGTSYQGQVSAIEFHLTVVDLEGAELHGTGQISLSGIDVDMLSLVHSGVGGIDLAGVVQQQSVVLGGVGDYDARHLDSAVADVRILGTGSATVRVSDRLDARIDGTGSVYYFGDPVVQRTGNGPGSVERIGS